MKELKKQLLNKYIKTLNVNSKWFNDDIKVFEKSMKNQSEGKLQQRLSNMICLDGGSASFNKEIEDIKSELDKGGMYDMNNTAPESALD